MESDYLKYRGKCKEFAEAAIKTNPTLKLVRGHYFEPYWNSEEAHWWTTRPDGSIYDPSAKQFPSKGHGIYTEFKGILTCDQCGKLIKEEHAQIMGNYMVCSSLCALQLVGLK